MIYTLNDRNKARRVCNIAEGRVNKNRGIAWTKSAYRKYKRYTAVAIFRFLENNENTKIFFLKRLPWYHTNLCPERMLPYTDILDCKKHCEDCSLIRRRTFPIDYHDLNDLNNLQKFVEIDEAPMAIVFPFDFDILINNLRADINNLYDMLN